MHLSESDSALFLGPRSAILRVYGEERIAAVLQRMREASPAGVLEPDELARSESDASVILSTWGMPILTPEQIAQRLPNVSLVLYAAGSVQGFARPWIARGAAVVSAWRANAQYVARFVAAQAVLAMKGYARNVREYDGSRAGFRSAFRGHGVCGDAVCVLGAGAVGRCVIDVLRQLGIPSVYWDPMLSDSAGEQIAAERAASLSAAIGRGAVVTNHLADNSSTKRLIDAAALSALRPDATFINTGRGATIDEEALVALLQRRSDLTALLDVTAAEPMGADHPLRRLPNVLVTTHIAGAIGGEVGGLADLCLAELWRALSGQPLQHAITAAMLESLA